jgi:hypothetical protein
LIIFFTGIGARGSFEIETKFFSALMISKDYFEVSLFFFLSFVIRFFKWNLVVALSVEQSCDMPHVTDGPDLFRHEKV